MLFSRRSHKRAISDCACHTPTIWEMPVSSHEMCENKVTRLLDLQRHQRAQRFLRWVGYGCTGLYGKRSLS